MTVRQLRCHRCERAYDPLTPPLGCPSCADDGVPSNLRCEPPALGPLPSVTMGEGTTPLIAAKRLGRAYGLADLWVKNESANPTWSHKDRLAAAAVSAARRRGAHAVVVASTGNHGVAVAAYAARARIPCLVVTLPEIPPSMLAQIRSHGARVVATRTAEERYTLIRAGMDRFGWLPLSNVTTPPVGSLPEGVDGYLTIADEIVRDLGGEPPDRVVLPVAYGDALAGIWRGFERMRRSGAIARAPRMAAVELFGALERALADPEAPVAPVPTHESAAFSIGGPFATFQALDAVRSSGGTAISPDESAILAARKDLAELEGLYVETSSAAAFAALPLLRERGDIARDDRVVTILTASGLKDVPEPPPGGKLPVIAPDLDELASVLGGPWPGPHGGTGPRGSTRAAPR